MFIAFVSLNNTNTLVVLFSAYIWELHEFSVSNLGTPSLRHLLFSFIGHDGHTALPLLRKNFRDFLSTSEKFDISLI